MGVVTTLSTVRGMFLVHFTSRPTGGGSRCGRPSTPTTMPRCFTAVTFRFPFVTSDAHTGMVIGQEALVLSHTEMRPSASRTAMDEHAAAG